MSSEVWKPIEGYESFYKISNFGNIYSFRAKRNIVGDTDRFGYKRVSLFKNKSKKRFRVHRLVAMHFLEKLDSYMNLVINHLDCNPRNNNVLNLEWTTVQKNTIHALMNNRLTIPKGELNGQSILLEKDVVKILEMWNNGMSQKEIGKVFGVTRSAIAHVTQGNRWKHLQHLNSRGIK